MFVAVMVPYFYALHRGVPQQTAQTLASLQFAAVAVFAFVVIFWQKIVKAWRYRKMA